MKKFEHPNIIKVFDWIGLNKLIDGKVGYVMEKGLYDLEYLSENMEKKGE